MPPIVWNDGESAASESSFDRRDLLCNKRVRFDDRCNRVCWVYSFLDFRFDLWYSRAQYDDIMDENWDIVDRKTKGGFRESRHDSYRGLEPLTQEKPIYMSAVFAVIQEQERLYRQGAYCAEKIAQASQVMSREDKRIALKHAEQDYLNLYGKSKATQSKIVSDDKSITSTVSSSSSSLSSLTHSTKETRKVYVSPIRRVQRLLNPKKHSDTNRVMPQGIPTL
ncbi:hypothetical protein FisN_11Lh289 [Fistulifera solaris]|uniref:Uncharacterized protein n=1 Tax=Fistulifera solaris TaxID=1519565 RepID=A0A1Z5K103_FISSO|nr:hypothetical protein FisN_11Lh289 [Fistulifera solaris]|eukprot:GAX19839.1 hypothetical protein FisN_11Lh289 [Fistulifera solaris]